MIVIVGLAAILIRLSFLWLLPVPAPTVHDEFSYLLASDTFVHGRLTNPPHPMWIFFDTFHVNQHPTYMSKYPPAQGAFLAVGQLLGNPWFGVMLSVALMCGATLWMMHGWLPASWALLGAILVLLRLGIFSYWMNSFWGGAVAATGGALVLGAMPRVMRFRRARDAVILGVGMAVLANSRPLEGLILCAPVLVVLLFWLFGRNSPSWRGSLSRIALPVCAVMLFCGAFIAYYNWRGTGNALLFPYTVNERAYMAATPSFFWVKPKPPTRFLNPQFESFYNGWSRTAWLEGHVDSARQAVRHMGLIVGQTGFFYFWPELCVPLIALPWVLGDRRVRFLVVQASISFLGLLLVPWTEAVYAAPMTATLFVLVTQAIRHLRQWPPGGRPVGVAFSRVVVLCAILFAAFDPHAQALPHAAHPPIEQRARFEEQLDSTRGEHLVIVRYSPNHHDVGQEWVYNRADIDHTKVVWAREIPGVDIAPLLHYFQGRQVWLAEPDADPPRLIPYPENAGR